MIRLLMVDDHTLFQQGLLRLLKSAQDIEVAGTAGNGVDALRILPDIKPNLVLLDISMPEMDGRQLAESLARLQPDIRIIFLTMLDSQVAFLSAIRYENVFGYVLKDCAFAELITAIRTVASGDRYFSPGLDTAGPCSIPKDLTPRECEVLRLTSHGLTAFAVGRKLGISMKTVENHRAHIMQKLDADNMTAAVVAGAKSGLI